MGQGAGPGPCGRCRSHITQGGPPENPCPQQVGCEDGQVDSLALPEPNCVGPRLHSQGSTKSLSGGLRFFSWTPKVFAGSRAMRMHTCVLSEGLPCDWESEELCSEQGELSQQGLFSLKCGNQGSTSMGL